MRKKILAFLVLTMTAIALVGGALGQNGGKLALDIVSTTEWSKTGTGTIFKMTRIRDQEAKTICYIMDVGPREHFSCVKD